MIACTIRAIRSSPQLGDAGGESRDDLAFPVGVAGAVVLEVLHRPGQGDAARQQVAELVVDVVDQPAQERQRVRPGPRHPYVGCALLRCPTRPWPRAR